MGVSPKIFRASRIWSAMFCFPPPRRIRSISTESVLAKSRVSFVLNALVRSSWEMTPARWSWLSTAEASTSFASRAGVKMALPNRLRMCVRGLPSMARYRQAFQRSSSVTGS